MLIGHIFDRSLLQAIHKLLRQRRFYIPFEYCYYLCKEEGRIAVRKYKQD